MLMASTNINPPREPLSTKSASATGTCEAIPRDAKTVAAMMKRVKARMATDRVMD
jgi:hypothetical protein